MAYKWLRWIVPFIESRRLLSSHKSSVSLGAAIGTFFAILIPIGQIPAAIILSFCLRGNIMFASAATFISNPITYIPFYIIAYQIGYFILNLFIGYDFNGEISLIDATLSLIIGLIILSLILSILTYILFRIYFFYKVIRRYRRIKLK